jgi:hypothetical protein
MMLESGLYIRIKELEGGPTPLPLKSGFNTSTAYRAVGMYNPSETADAYYILCNDRDETWFICSRHVRIVGVFPECRDLRFSIKETNLTPMLV